MKALKHDFEITEEMKLPEPFKTDWLKDLRGGKYGKTKDKLTDFDGNYCCLGVACKTAGYDDDMLRANSGGSATIIFNNMDGYSLVDELPLVPKQLQGYSENNKVVGFLSVANDNSDTFKQIANWIEKYL